MRGHFYASVAQIDKMEQMLCDLQEAADNAAELPTTAEMAKLFGDIDAILRKLGQLNQDRAEPKRPADDRAAQALGWPECH